MIRTYALPLTPDQSSALEHIAYDHAKSVLTVTFRRGHAYEYTGISLALALGLLRAESKGKYYNRVFRGLPSKEVII